MPWLPKARKDVVSCEKLRGSANRGTRMVEDHVPTISWGERRELKHLSTCRKRKKISIPRVVAIEMGRA